MNFIPTNQKSKIYIEPFPNRVISIFEFCCNADKI